MQSPTQDFVTSAIAILLGAAIVLSTAVAAASPATPEEGFDYQVLSSPQPTKAGGKVEVIEFFWYDCPHCNAMAPLIEPWAKRHRNSIAFKRIPVARNKGAILQQQLYYALESLGKVEELHSRIFNAIHEEWIPMKTTEQMAAFLEKQGVGKNEFLKIINSAAVMKKVQRAQQLTVAYGVDSVPTIAINGQYVTSASMLGGNQADVLSVVDYLVTKSKRSSP
ncbi:DSBA oxidoreductase [Sulfuricella sp. T08]|uniref:thiol:disulfide interchange protein DsbA/DsbL n=1 Tax=Sulfuricella sp. T08 TaxID=1632857 RepID=UPI000617A095|nr:thiol:disulfide interchange protein DsbA/DsbL [Sulfuricella sp. T08]GAO37263.1 DSBA oxidoreductase [Sulfuricella sp. T08]